MPNRDPISPVANAATGSVAAGIGNAASLAIVSANPEFLPFAWMIGTAITGTLAGVGNAARSRPVGSLLRIFGWLG